jgi:beta-glucanase (GH16 family)
VSQDSTWRLVWSDEFNDGGLDTNSWSCDTGTGWHGWGNNELQYYTAGDNIFFDDSTMTFELREQNMAACGYTSARIHTNRKVSFQYGKIQARIRGPFSKGVWPAFWTLGEDFQQVKHPGCGEIDIFEMACGDDFPDDRGDQSNFSVVHYTDLADFPAKQQASVAVNGRLADDFHIVTLSWDEQNLSFYFDTADTPYLTVDITKPYLTEFHQRHFLLIDLALGGSFAGWPNETTVFPQHLSVDWIRWYQKKAVTSVRAIRADSPASSMVVAAANGLSLHLPRPATSSLRVYDLHGRCVADLSRQVRRMAPGVNTLCWDSLKLGRGMYVFTLEDAATRLVGRSILIP